MPTRTSTGCSAGLRMSRGFASGAETSVRLDVRRETGARFRGGFFGTGRTTGGGRPPSPGTAAFRSVTHRLSASASVGLSFAECGDRTAPRWAVTSISIQDEWRLAADRVSVVPSLRLDQAGPFVGLSPKLGVSWSLPARVRRCRRTSGQSFRIPSFPSSTSPPGPSWPTPISSPSEATSSTGVPGSPRRLGLPRGGLRRAVPRPHRLRLPAAPGHPAPQPRRVRAAGLELEGRLSAGAVDGAERELRPALHREHPGHRALLRQGGPLPAAPARDAPAPGRSGAAAPARHPPRPVGDVREPLQHHSSPSRAG